MPLLPLDPQQARAAVRAVKQVVTADGPMHEAQRRALGLALRHFLHLDDDLDSLAPIAPEELAGAVGDPALRRQLIQVMSAYVLLGKDIQEDHLAAVRRYARALDVDEPAVDHLRYVIEDRLRLLRFDFRRRTAVGGALRDSYQERGLRGVFSTAMQLAGHGEDPALARRFHALEGLPEGTLGHGLWRFYRENGFVFPGDPGGTPLPLITHDLVHILAGYTTDVLGEVRTLAFQTGFKRENPLMFMFLLLFQVQLGINVVALVPGAGAGTITGFFDEPGVLEEVFRAYQRGAAMRVDLFDHWDFWAVIDQPVAALRERYGVPAV